MLRSVYFTDAFKKFAETTKPYAVSYVHPLIKRVLPFLGTANLIYTSIDDFDFSQVEEMEEEFVRSYSVSKVDCDEKTIEEMKKRGYTAKEWGTFIIDLSPDEGELTKNIKKSARKLVRRTQKICTLYECTSKKDLRVYYNYLKKSRKKLGFRTVGYEAFEKQWDAMYPETYRVFMIKHEEEIYCAMGVIFTKDLMIEVAAARIGPSNVYANDMLKYELMLWGKKQGIRYYDLSGVNPRPKEGSKEQGIYDFKKKWGGKYHNWYQFTKVRTDTWYFSLVAKLQKLFS